MCVKRRKTWGGSTVGGLGGDSLLERSQAGHTWHLHSATHKKMEGTMTETLEGTSGIQGFSEHPWKCPFVQYHSIPHNPFNTLDPDPWSSPPNLIYTPSKKSERCLCLEKALSRGKIMKPHRKLLLLPREVLHHILPNLLSTVWSWLAWCNHL